MRYIKVELKRAILSPAFFIAVIGMAAILVYCANETIAKMLAGEFLAEDVFISSLSLSSLRDEAAMFAIPIVAAIPFACGILDDISSHFIKELLTRTSKLNYTVAKIIAVLFSAGLAAVMSIFLFDVTIYIISALTVGSPLLNAEFCTGFLKQSGIYFIYFALWSVMGAVFGTLTDSKCVVYSAPFIFYYILIIIKDRYLYNFDAIDPRMWCRGTRGVITIAVLLAAVCLGLYATVRRRLNNV